MNLDPQQTAVIVVDMQNGFCHPEGSLYAEASEEALEPVTGLVDRARAAEADIIYTRDVHPPEQFSDAHYYDEFDRWGEHVLEGTWDASLHDALDVRDDDHIVEKHTYDAFYRTNLEAYLDTHNLKDLLICGTLANVCVLHTAASAGLRDFRPIVVEDAVGYLEADHRSYAVDHADFLFGERTTQSEVRFQSD